MKTLEWIIVWSIIGLLFIVIGCLICAVSDFGRESVLQKLCEQNATYEFCEMKAVVKEDALEKLYGVK